MLKEKEIQKFKTKNQSGIYYNHPLLHSTIMVQHLTGTQVIND